MQFYVLIVTLVLMAVIALIFLNAVRSSANGSETKNVDRKRSLIIWALLIFGIVVTVGSLREWPHAVASRGDGVQINASSGQWYWDLDRETVPQGETVVFNVRTEDVTHGFGVFDAKGTLLFQTQAIPGYVTQVQHVFEEPGTYRVLCLEYCGLAHDEMAAEFEVTAQ